MNFIILVSQLTFAVVATVYFLGQMRRQREKNDAFIKHAEVEQYRLSKLRRITLSRPLAEKTRPSGLAEIVGQEKGILALRAAICSPMPQHVIIYGPPGIGKTAAARVILEEAKKMSNTPFLQNAKFIEADATIMRFDERGIADPLLGSVHDPIYQGAGAFGGAGIPQPKPGAVTRAHGGVLFLDEIGELHPIQMNKLLKVLEDGKVQLESAYYNPEDKNTPPYIKDVFENGLPADFRLIGATTRQPSEIPPALRSRCVEIFFDPLTFENLCEIIRNTARKSSFYMEDDAVCEAAGYAKNGREAVSIVQLAGGLAAIGGRETISVSDVQWVAEFSKCSPRMEQKARGGKKVGSVYGLGVSEGGVGALIEIEAKALSAGKRRGKLTVTGLVEQEEAQVRGQKLRRKSTAYSSVLNVLTVLENLCKIPVRDYDIHLNFPGGMPVDGPSAGIAIFTAVYSALTGLPVEQTTAMTGEITIKGEVRPVGGVIAKTEAAKKAGIDLVVYPADNDQGILHDLGVATATATDICDVLRLVFDAGSESGKSIPLPVLDAGVLTAKGM